MNRLLILLLIICCFSCGINRKTISSLNSNTINLDKLIKNINSNTVSPDWTSIKGKIHFRSQNQKINLNTNIKIKKDSIIWMSVSLPIVGELFRGVITKDSIYYLDRKNSKYFENNHKYLNRFFTSNSYFELISQIISSSTIFSDSIEYKVLEGKHIVISDSCRYTIDPNTFTINEFLTSNVINDTLTIKYLNYHLVDEFLYPKKINISLRLEDEYNLSINYTKISLNKPQDFSFNIPENYEKIP